MRWRVTQPATHQLCFARIHRFITKACILALDIQLCIRFLERDYFWKVGLFSLTQVIPGSMRQLVVIPLDPFNFLFLGDARA